MSNLYFNYQYIDFYKYVDLDKILTYNKSLITPPLRYRLFNTSIAKLTEETFIYAVRWDANFFEGLIVPGNSEDCTNKDILDIGKNFWWNKWGSIMGAQFGGTIFFVGNHKKNDLSLCQLNYIPVNSPFSYLAGEIHQPKVKPFYINEEDIRICKIDDVIYMYNNGPKYLCQLDYKPQEKQIVITLLKLTLLTASKDKNQSILALNPGAKVGDIEFREWYWEKHLIPSIKYSLSNPYVKLLNWFYQEGIRMDLHIWNQVKTPIYEGLKPDLLKKIIPYDKFIIDGGGSYDNNSPNGMKIYGPNYGIMPMFSFTTPHLFLQVPTFGKIKLGVGHIKIHTDPQEKPYLAGSRIQSFRENLYRDYKQEFGDKYVRHLGTGSAPNCWGYNYLIYFYFVYDDDSKMKISDAYLPLNLNPKVADSPEDKDYKFSLVFPMGLEMIGNDTIIVTAGEGDFYSIALEFNLQQVINLCRYDATNLDLRNYFYYIIATKDNKTFVDETLNKIKQKMIMIPVQKGGGRRYRLINFNF